MSSKRTSTHFDDEGNVHMVDVSEKAVTKRVAVASSQILMQRSTARSIQAGEMKKGDVLAVARLAAIGATKWTNHLIPLCHAIPIEAVSVDFQWDTDQAQSEHGATARPDDKVGLECFVTVTTSAKTGVEMEAMTGASVAALTIYDMAKSIDRGMSIGPTRLETKSGGKSGDYSR